MKSYYTSFIIFLEIPRIPYHIRSVGFAVTAVLYYCRTSSWLAVYTKVCRLWFVDFNFYTLMHIFLNEYNKSLSKRRNVFQLFLWTLESKRFSTIADAT